MYRHWDIVRTGPAPAEQIMARDAQLLADMELRPRPILHLYEWQGPSATYGHFVQLDQHIDLEAARQERVNFAQRPTGGGIVFHLTDLAFSLLLPSTDPAYSTTPLDNYGFVNAIVAQAVAQFIGGQESLSLLPTLEEPEGPAGFCMARPTRYDVMWEGKKIGGAAQRRTRHGYLHQGTIAIAPAPQPLLERLLRSSEVARQMARWSPSLLPEEWGPHQLQQARLELCHWLVAVLPK
jgi:lipoate---protein ligase